MAFYFILICIMAKAKTSAAESPAQTAGPWKIKDGIESGHLVCKAGAFPVISEHELGNDYADALLIAAAPEMLEVLETLDEWSQSHGDDFPYWIVERVIAKAIGKAA